MSKRLLKEPRKMISETGLSLLQQELQKSNSFEFLKKELFPFLNAESIDKMLSLEFPLSEDGRVHYPFSSFVVDIRAVSSSLAIAMFLAICASSYQITKSDKIDRSISSEATKTLCKLKTNAASNILHLVVNISDKDVDVGEKVGWGEDSYYVSKIVSVTFKYQRSLAHKELANRGNPPYQSNAYLS